ncbi:pancreatic triacylglycerol lipase-like [Lucilia sericata]|uniref:pancreatic triacylglycerol lipase-like n=1 Tax=Lucilia sericata TaxID=13632 RepID=UPI0018A87614|nr:pancreatic triacylglycerol lipase-like [Lucilia sericata]
MENFRNLFTIIIVLLNLWLAKANIDNLVQRANIYYQQPLHDGQAHEFTLDTIVEPSSKTDIKVIIHGFLGNRFHNSIRPLRNAYMAQGKENVFLVDWENAANLDYPSSRLAVGKVAIFLGKLLENYLNKHEIPLSEVHLIGHSLGAHIAGNMGRYFNGSIGRVTGLDPALPLFTPNAADSLHANAALFVDVIHTDFPVFGDNTPRGTMDFYPNYGHTPQKGCDDVDIISASKLIFEAYSCSHNRAVILYAESIALPQNFPAIPCSLMAISMHSSDKCLQKIKDSSLSKSLADAIAAKNDALIAYMGEGVSRSASGSYYLETYDAPPYGMALYTQLN